VTRRIKKFLNFPINISISPSKNPEELSIEAERLIPDNNIDNDSWLLYAQNTSNDQ